MYEKLILYKEFLDYKRPIQKTILKKMESELKLDYIYNTNAIEGNTITKMETNVILEYGLTVKGKSLKEHLEIKGQEYAINFLNEELKYNTNLSIPLIKSFHTLIMKDIDAEISGIFKKHQNFILGSEINTSHPLHVAEDLEKIIDEYNNSEENLIYKIAKFHADFEKIHPFTDGNGRTGRLLINYELMRNGFPICIIKNKDRLIYYEALEIAQSMRNYEPLKNFIEKSLENTFLFYFKYISNDWEKEYKEFLELSKEKI